ncbi:TPA: glycosyltransferase, partial [Streptococcus suis]
MKSEVKVLIMLASYNGEKYIEEQILSIIKQDFKNWDLLIQDDGSTDNTVEIVRKFVEIDNRIQLRINTSDFHGPYYNFHTL